MMGEFKQYDAAAALGSLAEAVTHLSTFERNQDSEARICRKRRGLVGIEARRRRADPSDTVAEEELVEASASPLNQKERDGLTRSSLPMTSAAGFDSLSEPFLDLSFEPADGSLTEFDSLREALFRLQPVDHRST
jgi:hypothetical protein